MIKWNKRRLYENNLQKKVHVSSTRRKTLFSPNSLQEESKQQKVIKKKNSSRSLGFLSVSSNGRSGKHNITIP